mmetsp:Transcript_61449/g.165075  ORF Transcript_61449/g.165075 Transcript_61449/m.165075 type:complete len:96 (+) Transcript_61449:232-519(+)
MENLKRLPGPPVQSTSLFSVEDHFGFTVTKLGAIISLADGRVVLDPDAHGGCHRMKPSEDLSRRTLPRALDYDEIFVISQVGIGHSQLEIACPLL